VDQGDHNLPWWTRSVLDHLGPRSDIFLMLFFFHCRLLRVSHVVYQLFTLLLSTARVFLFIPPPVFICIFPSDRLVEGGFLILHGWCVVGLVPESLGFMGFALAPGLRKIRDGGLSLP